MNLTIIPMHIEDFRQIGLNARRAIVWPHAVLPDPGDAVLVSLISGKSHCYRMVTDVNGEVVSIRPMHSNEKALLPK